MENAVGNAHQHGIGLLEREFQARRIRYEHAREWGTRDFVIHGDGGSLIPVKLYCGDGVFFKYRSGLTDISNLVISYIWDVYESPKFFFINSKEALGILGKKPLNTVAWRRDGVYGWSSATGLPKERKKKMESLYADRWEWLIRICEKQG